MSTDTETRIFWKDPALFKLAQELLHQQLYVIGRDIESKHGNLLIQYGFTKTCAPEGCAASLYSIGLTGGYRLALRGFGVFIGHDRLGGLFVHRFEVEPRWMPSSRFVPVAWLPEQMPPTRRILEGQEESAIALTTQVFRLLHHYESWVRQTFGNRYRVGQLVGFRRIGNNVVHWDAVRDWESLC